MTPDPRQLPTAMTTRRTCVVACLAGHGIGPEITAAASRALARLSREHGFDVEELHPPFDTEALTRSGHMLPAATRRATSTADAVLVAGDAAPALDGLRAELDLAAPVSPVSSTRRVRPPRSLRCTTWPRTGRSNVPSHHRTQALGAPHVGRVSDGWTALVERHADRHPGVEVEHVSLPDALRRLAAGSWACSLPRACSVTPSQAPRLGGRRRLVASAALAERPEPVRPRGGDVQRPRGPRRRRSERDAARHRAAPLGGPRPHAAGEALEESPDRGAARVAPPVGGVGPRRLRDDARVRRCRARPASQRSSRHGVRARSRAMRMTGGDAILRSLEAEGVDVMFGIPGGAIMPTYDAMARGTTVRHVLARHEQGAGHMAQDTPAPPVASAWRSRRRDRARRTSSRRSPTRGWTRRRSSASPGRCARP